MRNRLPLILLFWVTTCLSPVFATAVRILEIHPAKKEIVILQEFERALRWHISTSVCIVREKVELVCGQIVKANPYRVVVSLDQPVDKTSSEALANGGTDGFLELIFGDDLAHRSLPVRQLSDADRRTVRTIASAPVSTSPDLIAFLAPKGFPDDAEKYESSGLQNNFLFGISYFFPQIEWQHTVTKTFAVGLTAQYLSGSAGSGTLAGPGGMITFDFYPRKVYRGFLGHLGVGAFSLTATDADGNVAKLLTPAAVMEIGWRWIGDSGINVGVAAGLQYLLRRPSVELGFSGAYPVATVDIGFAD